MLFRTPIGLLLAIGKLKIEWSGEENVNIDYRLRRKPLPRRSGIYWEEILANVAPSQTPI